MNTTLSTTPGEPDSTSYIGFNKDNESDLQSTTDLNDAMLSSATSPIVTFSTTTNGATHHNNTTTPNVILYNFIFMSILFSSNHGCVVACLSLATARLGSLGAYQNGLL
jgi:hypothetical protein